MDAVPTANCSEVAEARHDKRAQIDRLEAALLSMPQAEIETTHTFGPGFYARTIRVPAGTVLTGFVHKTEHIFILSQGEMNVATEDGMHRVRAPFQMVCRPGLKRAGHALTECVCTNVHITTETDLGKLEAELIEKPALPAPEQKEELPWLG